MIDAPEYTAQNLVKLNFYLRRFALLGTFSKSSLLEAKLLSSSNSAFPWWLSSAILLSSSILNWFLSWTPPRLYQNRIKYERGPEGPTPNGYYKNWWDKIIFIDRPIILNERWRYGFGYSNFPVPSTRVLSVNSFAEKYLLIYCSFSVFYN